MRIERRRTPAVRVPQRACRRWRKVDGERVVCNYPSGHAGDCLPVKLASAAARRAQADRLLEEHLDAACDPCREFYAAVVTRGKTVTEAWDLRCAWSATLAREATPELAP